MPHKIIGWSREFLINENNFDSVYILCDNSEPVSKQEITPLSVAKNIWSLHKNKLGFVDFECIGSTKSLIESGTLRPFEKDYFGAALDLNLNATSPSLPQRGAFQYGSIIKIFEPEIEALKVNPPEVQNKSCFEVGPFGHKYIRTQGAEKIDVWNFGWFILKNFLSIQHSSVKGMIQQSAISRLGELGVKNAKIFSDLILDCIHEEPSRRPTMKDVIYSLKILNIHLPIHYQPSREDINSHQEIPTGQEKITGHSVSSHTRSGCYVLSNVAKVLVDFQTNFKQTLGFPAEFAPVKYFKKLITPEFNVESACYVGRLLAVDYFYKKIGKLNQYDPRRKGTELTVACQGGHLEVIQFLVEQRANVNYKSTREHTPLSVASRHGHLEIVKFLLKNKADPNQRGWDRALSEACRETHKEVAELLVQHKANVNELGYSDRSALDIAIMAGDLEMVKFLCLHKAHINNPNWEKSPLHNAILFTQPEIVQFLVQNKANIYQAHDLGYNSLDEACNQGDAEIVKILIDSKANINQSSRGGTPLVHAIETNHFKIVKLLLEHKADMNPSVLVRNGLSLLQIATNSGNSDIAALLIQNGASVNQMANNRPPLVNVILHEDNVHTARILIENRADVNCSMADGDFPLIVAVAMSRAEIVKLLIEKRADINRVNHLGMSSLCSAAYVGNINIVRLLVKHKANVNKLDSKGWSPILTACQNPHPAVVKFLTEKKANLNQGNQNGITPVFLATKHRNVELLSFLAQHQADVNQARSDGAFPLIVTSALGYLETCKALVLHGANVNQESDGNTPLHAASQEGQTETVRFLLQSRADARRQSAAGLTAMDVAIFTEHTDIVQLLQEELLQIDQPVQAIHEQPLTKELVVWVGSQIHRIEIEFDPETEESDFLELFYFELFSISNIDPRNQRLLLKCPLDSPAQTQVSSANVVPFLGPARQLFQPNVELIVEQKDLDAIDLFQRVRSVPSAVHFLASFVRSVSENPHLVLDLHSPETLEKAGSVLPEICQLLQFCYFTPHCARESSSVSLERSPQEGGATGVVFVCYSHNEWLLRDFAHVISCGWATGQDLATILSNSFFSIKE